MARYRKQQTPGDNLRDLYSKLVQMVSAALGESSIDDDDGALEVRVAESPVAKMGHDGSKHGLLVPNGGGWRTVQEDAQAKADAAEAAAVATANAHSNSLNTAMDGRMDTAESDINTAQSDINTLQSEMNTAQSDINDLQADVAMLKAWRLAHIAESG